MTLIYQKPRLTKFQDLKEYIDQVDRSRYYSNFGPLYDLTEKKISNYLKLKKNKVVLTSSGHSSILTFLLNLKKETKKKFVLVQSFNFASSVQAIIQSKFTPFFIDISPTTLTACHSEITHTIKKLNHNVAGIILTSPFGYPLNILKLNAFQKKIKTPIIYDAADTFINFNKDIDLSEIVICGSFHPTKTLPANESGIIVCRKKIYSNLKKIISFGLNSNKEVVSYGFNGKFSEYDAAILLSNMSNIKIIKNIISRNKNYLFSKVYLLKKNQFSIFKDKEKWFSTKLICFSKKKKYINLKKLFLSYGIKIYPAWHEKPLHMHKFFKKIKRNKLPSTNDLIKKVFIIPLNIDVSKKEIQQIVHAIDKIF
jgi:dTDP-4-amino-4,6-dideoxygalactose transaminase